MNVSKPQKAKRPNHWTGSLAFRLFLFAAILVVPLCLLGAAQYDQVHRAIAQTQTERNGLVLLSQAAEVLQRTAEVGPGSPPSASAEVDRALSDMQRIADGMPDVPVASGRIAELRASWARAEKTRDPALLGAFGNQLLDAVNDIADATRFSFESQIAVGDMADVLDNTYAHLFERLIAAYRNAAATPTGKPASMDARIAMAGSLARADSMHAPLNLDLRETFVEEPAAENILKRPWNETTRAATDLEASLQRVMRGDTVTPALTAELRRHQSALLRASATFLRSVENVEATLLEVRFGKLEQSERALTSFWFAGCALLLGISILVGRSVSRRHRRELLRAQEDAERLSAELARQRAERALLLTEAQFRAVFERSQLGIAMLARDGTPIESNGALRAMVGDGVSALIAPGDAEFAALVEGRRGTYHNERNIRRADGSTVWVEITVSPVAVPQPEETAAIAIVQDITERKAVDEHLRYVASHDELTDLPNRSEFVREVSAVLAAPQKSGQHAVLFIDLDGFKLINDGLGHFAGDRVLASTARRLRAACRPGDVVARFHGDEFAILLRNIAGEQAALAAAERVQRELRTPISVGGSIATVAASVGIVSLHAGYVDAEQVLRNADAAMYHAKSRGRSTTALFDESMYQAVASHFRIASELRNALSRGEIHLAYQPIVSLGDGAVVGLEGLLRWTHPQYGPISPDDFIPVAEETDTIFELGRYALEQAGSLMKRLDVTHPAISPQSISVNLSVAQLGQGDIVGDVRRTLRQNDLEGKRLLLEVTESAIMDNGAHASAILASLRELGVRLCIDDFGTGYSSLRYLHEFPFDVLKIDRTFVRGPAGLANEPIVTMLMRLAESLKVTVIAEGVETEEQRVKLRDGGCRFGQGFLFAPALDEEQIVPWLQAAAERKAQRHLRVAP